ncbi:MAG: bifunctional phosphopantothenoylcysteine decarboxylase/phosphopantothenate--cysteine ligase CoaBC [Acidaminococcaceae bacterium]|nr:bifunctional phosphopantothenoylcysteine decarboxylase/phosphopantothenate--cysteine ligase CoaBC [Acidaminococcaceae bacterium]MBQ9257546.1 bifunctional phosphopantothenoylcysteine decarboxylase/phosphopantothenate--cysteine ligase CoaBC [Acidaminococcaceae bacterium]MBR1512445.1 bifunctional phosphopantothenoylcysteine decarboxylase/phosphopantothenate--cysteine ligase CoaBC [Acidaminococcaceae bacterium]
MLKGKKIVLGVTGGIAIFKAVDLVSKLRKRGAEIRVVMTEHATKFISPLLFSEISGNKCSVSMWDGRDEFNVEHIALANWGDLILTAPATANIIAKMACGLADDLLSTVLLAASCPKIVCPAMNTGMYENPATQENLKILEKRGIFVMEPASGELACGTSGAGRLPEVPEIISYLERFLAKREGDMRGLKVLVTAAGTREPIDPVRYVGNRSSGKMGYSIARQALLRGADVTLITGPSALTPPPYAKVIPVETTKQMLDACLSEYPDTDIVIKAAAVADFKPRSVADQKIKKINPEDGMTIVMDQNPDILKTLGGLKKNQFLVGFAAETQNLLENAANKVKKKNLDMIVANDVSLKGAGFNTDTNIVKFLYPDGTVEALEILSKDTVAAILLDRVLEKRKRRADTVK